MAPIINFKKLEANSRMQFKLTAVSQLPQIAEEIKIGRQLRESKERVLKNILEGNGYRKIEEVDIKKPLCLGVLPRGNRYSLFLDVTPEIERIVRDNVRWVRREVYEPLLQLTSEEIIKLAEKENITDISKIRMRELKVTQSLLYIIGRWSHASKNTLAKLAMYSGPVAKWYKKVYFGGEWDYKKRQPLFSKSQSQKDRYSQYFTYAKAPNKIIRYDFLGNYNYAVTGMYVLTGIPFIDKELIDQGNKRLGGVNDQQDKDAIALGKKNYKQYI